MRPRAGTRLNRGRARLRYRDGMPPAAPPAADPAPTGLVLQGGGARTAYQAGVLAGVLEVLEARWPAASANPFPIVCGTSAGAINAGYFAAHCTDWRAAIAAMPGEWERLTPGDVFHVGTLPLARGGLGWLRLFAFGWLWRQNPRSLLDNRPLERTLARLFPPGQLTAALEAGALQALSVSASGYTLGRHVSFFQAARAHPGWRQPGEWAVPARIEVAHLLASSALPFIFPAVPLACGEGTDYFGDGAMRQLAPLAPAIHLGAQRILAIDVAEPRPPWPPPAGAAPAYPSLAQIAGHAMASIFLDTLRADAHQATRINAMLEQVPPALRESLPLHPLPVLAISPSQSISAIAARHWRSMPGAARRLLEGVGTGHGSGAMLASYLLFTGDYLHALVELGRADARAHRAELEALLTEPGQAPAARQEVA